MDFRNKNGCGRLRDYDGPEFSFLVSKKKSPENYVVISDPVKRELDITFSVFELEKNGRSPILFFENVSGFELPVVTNVSGNRNLLAWRWEPSLTSYRCPIERDVRVTYLQRSLRKRLAGDCY